MIAKELAAKGLNIFATCPLNGLPDELRREIPFAGKNLCVLGHGGRLLWENLPKPVRDGENPVDNFVMREVLARIPDAKFIYPHPLHVIPLQRLGRFLNIGRPSVMGLDIHAEFGVWWAYRAAFLTDVPLGEFIPKPFDSPCDTCADKPCRAVCPSQAVQERPENFKLANCAEYRFSESSKCSDRCLARMNCSYKPEHQYALEQQQYHMGRVAHLARMRAQMPSQ